jgi:drug/metabolite transporter (DMT)-like permease
MNAPMTTVLAYLLLFVALLTTAFAQVAFKHFHLTGKRSSLATAVGLFLLIPPATFVAVRYLGIGKVYVLTSLNYGFVAFLGWKYFGERISGGQLQGLALITLGCLVNSL